MSIHHRVAAAARETIGVRFRPQGRDPRFGLDCVGLAAHALGAAGWSGTVPTGYSLRGGSALALVGRIAAAGLVRADVAQEGDLLLLDAGFAQAHLAIQVAGGIVHADAGLGRVVERPGPPPWQIVAAFRLPMPEEPR